MTTPPKQSAFGSRTILEGVFGIHKPQWASSAGVLRDLQTEFAKSELFYPWIESTRRQLFVAGSKKKHIDQLKVKLGHGGTLDPMATGVLVVGVGKGTKELGKFLECTKTYECVVLFGAATDSYDAVGKIVGKGDYAHVTRELVEEKLQDFRGAIMQKPSVFSALKVDGKKMYEYAREGKDIPAVAARPVTVEKLELVEWLEPGTHDFAWPQEEVDDEGKAGAAKLLGIRASDAEQHVRNAKRARSPAKSTDASPTPDSDHGMKDAGPQPKKPRTDSEPAMSGALPSHQQLPQPLDTEVKREPVPEDAEDVQTQPQDTQTKAAVIGSVEQAEVVDQDCTSAGGAPAQPRTPDKGHQPPAVRLRMTVTSGFYVRSLCHDLGLACNSLGLMSSLVRSRQGDYELGGEDVLEYSDLGQGGDVWEPKVGRMLERFMEREGWWQEELEDDKIWEKRKGELVMHRKLENQDRSDRGRGWEVRRRGGKGGGKYSKNMNGDGGGQTRDRALDK